VGDGLSVACINDRQKIVLTEKCVLIDNSTTHDPKLFIDDGEPIRTRSQQRRQICPLALGSGVAA
jgi:hypothetical protein